MTKYSYYMCVLSLIVNNVCGKTIIESQLINSMPYNQSNYLNLLSLVDSKSIIMNITNQNISTTVEPGNNLPPDQCLFRMNSFGRILSEYIHCLLINEVPFNICIKCATTYDHVKRAYQDLTNQTISKCPDTLLNSDKTSLINSFYTNSFDQWTDANCDTMSFTISFTLFLLIIISFLFSRLLPKQSLWRSLCGKQRHDLLLLFSK